MSVELSRATGFGALAVGVTKARFAVSPSASASLRGDGSFLVARDTASFLGATGDRFGIDADVRLDLFGPYLSGNLGVSLDCAGTWFTGGASAVWNGVSVRCSARPVFRFAPRS